MKYKLVTFVVRYHPSLKSFHSLINKHLNIFYLDKNGKKNFMSEQRVTFCSREKAVVIQ